MKKLFRLLFEYYGPPMGHSDEDVHRKMDYRVPPLPKGMGGHPMGQKNFPYEDPTADIDAGMEAVEDMEDGETVSETALYDLFSKHSQDNLSIPRPDAFNPPRAKSDGKSAKAYSSFDPHIKINNKLRMWNFIEKQKAGLQRITDEKSDLEIDPTENIDEGVGDRYKQTDIDPIHMTTRSAFANGMPRTGHNPAFEPMSQDPNEDVEGWSEITQYEDDNIQEWNTGDWEARNHKILHGPDADKDFWDRADSENDFLMNSEDDFKNKNKRKDQS